MNRTRLTLCLFLLFGIAFVDAKPPVNQSLFGKVAIKSYDPVAYFTDGKPVEGEKAHSHKWNGATWRFSSEANRKLFAAAPETYAPQYGGYCAWAVSQGDTAPIDPTQWTIHEKKLYLNYDRKVNETWTAKRDEFIQLADKNWPKVLE